MPIRVIVVTPPCQSTVVQESIRPAYHEEGRTGRLLPFPKTGVCATMPVIFQRSHVAVHWDDNIGGPELHPTQNCTYTLIHKHSIALISGTLGTLVNG